MHCTACMTSSAVSSRSHSSPLMNTSLQAAAPLRALNTFALPASATWLARVDDVRQLAALRADLRLAGRPRFISAAAATSCWRVTSTA